MKKRSTPWLCPAAGLLLAIAGACGAQGGPSADADADADGSDESGTPPADFLGEACDPYQDACPEGQKCGPIAVEPFSAYFEEYRCVELYPLLNLLKEECFSFGMRPDAYGTCDKGMYCFGAEDQPLPDAVDPEASASLAGLGGLTANATPRAPKHGENMGTCEGLCQDSADDPNCGSDWNWCETVKGVDMCIYTCNPLDPECPHLNGCLWDEMRETLYCKPLTTIPSPLGDDCTGCENCCDQGLHCDPAAQVPGCAGESCCNAWCSTDGETACALDGQTCVKFWPEGGEPPGQELVGYCSVEDGGETGGETGSETGGF